MDATYLSGMIPLLVPILIALGKAAIPTIPKWALPILAPVLGAGAEIAGHYAGLTTGNPVLGAALGALGLWLRELVDQIRKALAGLPPVAGAVLLGVALGGSPILTACATFGALTQADPEVRVAQTFDAFLTQVNETTDFYDALYRQRLLPQAEYDAFNAAYAKTRGTIDLLYRAFKAGEVIDQRADFREVRRDLAVFILTYLQRKETP